MLTSQKRGGNTILRESPMPTDPYSLKQAYQRWDYRDYAYLWTLLSNAEKQVYRTKASRYHITGFSQWMRENLKALTDIAGRWHLDEQGGAIAFDSSRNGNNGTIIGSSPATGLIAGARYFDNLNDYIDCGHSPFLNFGLGSFDIECFIKTTDTDQYSYIVSKRLGASYYVLRLSYGKPHLFCDDGTGPLIIASPDSIADGEWHHLVGRFDRDAGQGKIFVDTVDKVTGGIAATRNFDNLGALTIGRYQLGAYYLDATLDHITVYSRNLDTTEIARHSERRYTL